LTGLDGRPASDGYEVGVGGVAARLSPIGHAQTPVAKAGAWRAVGALEFDARRSRVQPGGETPDLHPIGDRYRLNPIEFCSNIRWVGVKPGC